MRLGPDLKVAIWFLCRKLNQGGIGAERDTTARPADEHRSATEVTIPCFFFNDELSPRPMAN